MEIQVRDMKGSDEGDEKGELFWCVMPRGLFCSCGKCGRLSSCNVQTSDCSGFPWCGARALGTRLQCLWCTGVVAPWRVESSQSGIELVSPVLAGGLFTTEPPGKLCITYLI